MASREVNVEEGRGDIPWVTGTVGAGMNAFVEQGIDVASINAATMLAPVHFALDVGDIVS